MYGPNTWPANTRLQLVKVKWDSQYRDLVSWDNATRDAWFNSIESTRTIVLDKASYAAMYRPVRLPLNIDETTQYNYIRVTNQNASGFARDYFYFIVGVDYVTPDVSLAHLQLDVWQTFHNDVDFNLCYVERGHVGIADFKSDVTPECSYGRAILDIPEGLDTGSHLPVINQEFASAQAGGNGSGDVAFMMTTTIDLTAEMGTVIDPKITMSNGNDLELRGDAGSVYFFDSHTEYKFLLTGLSKTPWVAQGIINVMAVPRSVMNMIKTAYAMTQVSINVGNSGVQSVNAWVPSGNATGLAQSDPVVHSNFRNKFPIPTRYQYLKKFRTFPYCAVELTNFTGQSLIIEPDKVWSNDLVVHMIATVRPGDARLVYYPKQYGAQSDITDGIIDSGEFMNAAITIDRLPTFSVLSNNGMMYLAANAHSIAYQRNAATWAQNKTMQGADVAASQATRNIQSGIESTGIDINAMNQSRELNNAVALAQGATGAIGAAGARNPAGAIGSGVNAAIGIGVNNANFNIQSGRMNAQRSLATNTSGYMRDTNKAYADYAASGDYQTAIAGINARIQDSQLQSPGVMGATGGDGLMLWAQSLGVMVRYRQITQSAMRVIGEYWLRFGYYVQMFMKPPSDLHVMTRFTYWKMKDTYISSVYAPEDVCNTIRGVFERGTTVWRDPDDIGTVDIADNAPIVGNYLNLKAPGEAW